MTIYNHLFQGIIYDRHHLFLSSFRLLILPLLPHTTKGINDPAYFLVPVLDSHPIGHRAQLHKEAGVFEKLIFDIIDTKREQIRQQGDIDEASADLLTMMIHATEQESPEKGLSAKELRVSTVNFLMLFVLLICKICIALMFRFLFLLSG